MDEQWIESPKPADGKWVVEAVPAEEVKHLEGIAR